MAIRIVAVSVAKSATTFSTSFHTFPILQESPTTSCGALGHILWRACVELNAPEAACAAPREQWLRPPRLPTGTKHPVEG